eukprot:6269388-Alexandrium_andersonii.AAC.1
MLHLQRRAGLEARRAWGRLRLHGLRRRRGCRGEAHGREVHVQDRGAPRWRPVRPAGSEATEPHHQ